MIEKIINALEEESQYSCSHCMARAIEIVKEVEKEYDEFDVIYKKVCELEKRYDEDAVVGNVNGCIRLKNLLQYFKEELKAPYQKGE